LQKNCVVISEKDLLALMQRAFEEGYVGYRESRDSVVSALLDEWKISHKPILDGATKWAVAHAATEDKTGEAALRRNQGQLRANLWNP
jgi:hypothetical protein